MSKSRVTLVCEECLSRNYSLVKSKSLGIKFELNKHCKTCNKHTSHIETR